MEDAPFITFTAPRRAESGAQVPLEISIDQTQADANAIKTLYDVDGLRLLYTDAVAAKVAPDVLAVIKAHGSAAKP